MTKIISSSIDLTKLKSAMHTTEKGTKCLLIPLVQDGLYLSDKGPLYLNFTTIVSDDKDKFGNTASFTLAQTKEQRDAKADKVYIGSGKTVWEGESKKPAAAKAEVSNEFEDSQDLPF